MACASSTTITLLSKFDRAMYDRKYGKYTLTRVYRVPSCSPEECIGLEYGAGVSPNGVNGDNKIPASVSIEHLSTYCDSGGGDDNAETVTCYAIDRQAARVPEGGGLEWADMTVTYIGWVMQPLFWETQIQTATEQLIASLDDPPQQIGAQGEGTSVFRSRIQMNIYENLTGETLMFLGRLALIEELTGTVNEDNWNPAVTEVNLFYPEGTWLYLGADITDQPGGVFNVMHKFMQIPLYCNCGIDWSGSGSNDEHTYGSSSYPCQWPQMHIFKYRNYIDVGSSYTVGATTYQAHRRRYGDEIERKTHCIAGTDTFHDFSDLGL